MVVVSIIYKDGESETKRFRNWHEFITRTDEEMHAVPADMVGDIASVTATSVDR